MRLGGALDSRHLQRFAFDWRADGDRRDLTAVALDLQDGVAVDDEPVDGRHRVSIIALTIDHITDEPRTTTPRARVRLGSLALVVALLVFTAITVIATLRVSLVLDGVRYFWL